ncbi:MAG: S8 family peptidase [Synechocystis sp.]|nr:S8 family peptidase [Synechocystis sp.]
MKRFLLTLFFIAGIWFSLSHYLAQHSLAQRGNFDSVIINFKDDIPTETLTADIQSITATLNKPTDFNSIFSINDYIYTVSGDKQALKQLRKSGLMRHVDYVEPNYVYQALEVPNDPEYSKQWNLRAIAMESAWDGSKGEGVTVAVIDTGVTRVPDLRKTEFVSGYNFVDDNRDTTDINGHGTHVAGTIAQATNNEYGVAGIAYQAKIMPLKVLGDGGGGTVADIAEAIMYAADNGATVINMSLGGGGESKTLADAIDYAYNKGVVIIAAAGNEGQNAAAYPGRYPKVISVAATDATGNKASYSNFGAGVDIAAPGGSLDGKDGKILQETIDPDTLEPVLMGMQGTSMAAPHVAGTAALIQSVQLQQAKVGLSEGQANRLTVAEVSNPEDVLKILKGSARSVGDDTLNYYGAGHLNAGEAVKQAKAGQVSFKDFMRWLRDNGYLNPIFWFDGGAVAFLPKLAMVLGSYLLVMLLRIYLPLQFTMPFNWGLIFGSGGLFFLQGLYIFDLPQWPFRALGSSLPELGNSIQGTALLNPFFASALIPVGLLILLLGNPSGKQWAIGLCLGTATFLTGAAILQDPLWLIGAGKIATGFLVVNALVCLGLGSLAAKESA